MASKKPADSTKDRMVVESGKFTSKETAVNFGEWVQQNSAELRDKTKFEFRNFQDTFWIFSVQDVSQTKFAQVEEWSIINCQLNDSLEIFVNDWKKLTKLDLSNNKLTKIPKLSNQANLTELRLAYNQITWEALQREVKVTPGVENEAKMLNKLLVLDLSNNAIDFKDGNE